MKKTFNIEEMTTPVYLPLPEDMSRTPYAAQLIVKLLEENEGTGLQHKEIITVMEHVLNEQNPDRRLFTSGHINGAFNRLNKDLTGYNLVKYKGENGGVYYKYTTDDEEVAELEQSEFERNLDTLIERLNEVFDVSNQMKSNIIKNDEPIHVSLYEVLAKISELETVMLKVQIKDEN